MYARIVKHDKRISFCAQGKVIEVLNDLVRVNAFSRGESMIVVVPVYHAEDIDSLCLLGRDPLGRFLIRLYLAPMLIKNA